MANAIKSKSKPSGNVRARLIKESRGSFSAVHKALKDSKQHSGSKPLDIDDVIGRIRKNVKPGQNKKAS